MSRSGSWLRVPSWRIVHVAKIARRDSRPELERLEGRLQLSAAIPANSIGTSLGNVSGAWRGHGDFGHGGAQEPDAKANRRRFLAFSSNPSRAARLRPEIVAVEGSNGQPLPLKQGRPYVAGRDSGQAAAFVKVSQPGPLTILVYRPTPIHRELTRSTRRWWVTSTATARSTQADLQPFAAAYETVPGDPNYNLAADFNQDGIVNQIDAKALMQNMPPLTPKVPLQLVMNLLPADQAQLRCVQEFWWVDLQARCHDRRTHHARQHRARG